MLMRRRILFFAASLALSASGAFFWKVSGSVERFLANLGGERMYASAVTVNGRDGELFVYTFPRGDADGLARALASDAPPGTRCFLIPGADSPLVLAVAGKAVGTGTPQWPDAIPPWPARPLFSAETRASNLSFLTAASDASPGEAALKAAAALSLAGYSEATPAGASCRLFVKGFTTALLFASGGPGGTRVTVLVREGAVKNRESLP